MTNFHSMFGLFIILVIALTMGLQFTNFKEGFQESKYKKQDTTNNNDLPIYTKTNDSMAKQSVFDDHII